MNPTKKWILREKVSGDLTEQLLHYRNIKLAPDYEKDQYDPFGILNMDKAVERILKAMKNNERVVVFSDYDADGVSAAAIFHEFFKKTGFENFHVHIPDRNLEGYGLTVEVVDEFSKMEAGLIITLDCGITDYEEVETANKAGVEVIIIDHHLPPEKLPHAFAILDTKQEGDEYPFKHLCGTGMVFKTIEALIKKMSDGPDAKVGAGWEKWFLDLVAIATIADMVPLVDENRTLALYGLTVLKKTRRTGLLSLCRRINLSPRNISEDDVGFMLAPRINIASRMEHANMSFNLLITQSEEEANWITGRMEVLNNERKAAVENVLRDAAAELEKEKEIPEIIVLGKPEWNQGVLSLAVNRMLEKYSRPVFMWGKGDSKNIKGSCRSDGSINVVELMKALPEGLLIDFGGHKMAGGFSAKEENIKDLKKEVLRAFGGISREKKEEEILQIDVEARLEDINENFYSIIEKFQPFGQENPRPVFLFSDLEIRNVKKFGNGGIHLQLDFDGVSAIGFFIANAEKYDLKKGQKIDMVASLEKSFFRTTPELRLRIVDVRMNSRT